MDSDSSETNIVIITKRDRLKLFWKLYWRIVIIIVTPLILLPLAFIGTNNAYKSFYIFLVTNIYWISDVLHPSVTSLIPVAMSSAMAIMDHNFISEVYVPYELLDSAGVMMIMIAIEYSKVQRRVALKVLLISGCSHYRLSFLLFFTSMFISMWVSNIMTCGLMMPLMKAILTELEKMGILEIYYTIGKATQKSNRHEQSVPRPTDFTVFYFLGIAYSASIGGMATLMGSQTNQMFKMYCETIFPNGPKIEFPHFMLLNLPGVLVMETLLYMWMNFYFVGMFRAQSDIALQIGMTDEEAQYINTLLATQYIQMGRVKFHEVIVGCIVIVTLLLQMITSRAYFDDLGPKNYRHFRVSSSCMICVIILFIMPTRLSFLRIFPRRADSNSNPLPNTQCKACLNWNLVRNNLNWSVLFITGGSGVVFENLKESQMLEKLEQFLLIFHGWPPFVLVLVFIIVCKIATEFASNSCVVYCILPSIAKVSIICDVNPHYLMMAATLASSLPVHLMSGSPVNSMVCAYVHIPPWKMMHAGIGPTLIAVAVTWFTVAVWSIAVWTDINLDSEWADANVFTKFVT